MKTILFLLMSAMVFSCSSQKNITEFIQLSHENVMVIAGDKLTVTLIPTGKNRKRPVIVKIFRKGETFDRKRISYTEYREIWDAVTNEINKPDFPKKTNYLFGVLDGGSNSILLKKDTIQQELNNDVDSEERYKKFYKATGLILKTAGLSTHDID